MNTETETHELTEAELNEIGRQIAQDLALLRLEARTKARWELSAEQMMNNLLAAAA